MVWSDPNPLGRFLVQPVPVACAFCGDPSPSDTCPECTAMLAEMTEVDK